MEILDYVISFFMVSLYYVFLVFSLVFYIKYGLRWFVDIDFVRFFILLDGDYFVV